MKKFYKFINQILLVSVICLAISGCKKESNNNQNNTTGWTEDERASYNKVITLQDSASNKFDIWVKTMDSLTALEKLHQYFLADPSVYSAVVSSQGISVQYKNGMQGGIFLNPEDEPEQKKSLTEKKAKNISSTFNIKSLVNNEGVVFLNPSYWERKVYADKIIEGYNNNLPKIKFKLLKDLYNDQVTVDEFKRLSGYGIVHIYTHGWAFPQNKNIKDVYAMTGEVASEATSKKYTEEIGLGKDVETGITNEIIIGKAKTKNWEETKKKENVYFVSRSFVQKNNDFSRDTVLFYGGFCYGYLGTWPSIQKSFASGTYFGFDWHVRTNYNSNWAYKLVEAMTDTLQDQPVNTGQWMSDPLPKFYFDDHTLCQKNVSIHYDGDEALTLWKSNKKYITSYSIGPTELTEFVGFEFTGDIEVNISGSKFRVNWAGLWETTNMNIYLNMPPKTTPNAIYNYDINVSLGNFASKSSEITEMELYSGEYFSSDNPGDKIDLDNTGDWTIPVSFTKNDTSRYYQVGATIQYKVLEADTFYYSSVKMPMLLNVYFDFDQAKKKKK